MLRIVPAEDHAPTKGGASFAPRPTRHRHTGPDAAPRCPASAALVADPTTSRGRPLNVRGFAIDADGPRAAAIGAMTNAGVAPADGRARMSKTQHHVAARDRPRDPAGLLRVHSDPPRRPHRRHPRGPNRLRDPSSQRPTIAGRGGGSVIGSWPARTRTRSAPLGRTSMLPFRRPAGLGLETSHPCHESVRRWCIRLRSCWSEGGAGDGNRTRVARGSRNLSHNL